MVGKWHLHTEPQGLDDYSYLSGSDGQGTYQDPEFRSKDGEARAQGSVALQ